MTDAQVLRQAGLLPDQFQLRIERIKFAARLFGKAPEELRKLAVSENVNDTKNWYGFLSQDLQHMTDVMHKELAAMPMYSSHPEQWHKLWADFPGAWKLLIKKFAQRLRESCSSSQELETAEDTQFEHVSSDLEGVHTCADCGKQFASSCGLGQEFCVGQCVHCTHIPLLVFFLQHCHSLQGCLVLEDCVLCLF